MTTVTTTVSIPEAKAGDLFSGEYETSPGVRIVVTDTPLVASVWRDDNLYPEGAGSFRYINTKVDGEYVWKNVRITREVQVKTRVERALELPVGTVFRAEAGSGLVYTKVSETRFICFQKGNHSAPNFYSIDNAGLLDHADDIEVIPDPKGARA